MLNISPNPCYSDRNKVIIIGRINFGNGSGKTQALNTTNNPSVSAEQYLTDWLRVVFILYI